MQNKNKQINKRFHCGFLNPICYPPYKTAKKKPKQQYGWRVVGRSYCRVLGQQCSRMGLTILLLVASLSTMAITPNDNSKGCYEIAVPRSNAAQAITLLAKQTQARLLFSYDLAQSKQAQPVVGCYTLEQALLLLLEGSGLTSGLSDKGLLTIAEVGSDAFAYKHNDGDEKMGVKSKKKVLASVISFFMGANSAALYAQEVEGTDGEGWLLEEVVVTAQKREQNLQDVPISMSVLGGLELDSGRYEGVNDAIGRVAGVQIFDTFQGGGSKIAVRGVASNTSLFDGGSVVGYYLDDVPFGFVRVPVSPDASAYDVQRVEVLRGPQGTLYGSSALNGVVRVITQDANLDETEFKTRASISNTDGGGDNYRGDVALSVPIIPGKLAVRGVLGYNEQSGWIDSPTNDDVNDSEISTYRLKVNAQPTDELAVEAYVWSSKDDSGANDSSDDDAKTLSPFDEPVTTDYDTYGLAVTYDFENFSLLSSTSYIDYDNEGVLRIIATADLVTIIQAELFAQEFRLTSNLDGPLQWSFGALYRDAEDNRFAKFERLADFLVPIIPSFNHNRSTSESIAVYGEVTRDFMDGAFNATLGLRYFEDDVTEQTISNAFNEGGVPDFPEQGKDTFSSTTPRLVLTWFPEEDTTVYGSYSQGFRSGFLVDEATKSQAPGGDLPNVEEDKLTNYELGAKGSAYGGLLKYDFALYYMEWEDVQQNLFVSLEGTEIETSLPLNGGDASGVGFDIGLTAQMAEGLIVGLTYSQNDLTFDDDEVSTGNGLTIFEKGSRLSESPEQTAGLTVDYSFDMFQGYQGRLSGAANYHSELNSTNVETAEFVGGDSIFITDISFAIESSDDWTVTAFVDNINNEYGVVRPVTSAPLYRNSRLRPRTAGLQFEYQF